MAVNVNREVSDDFYRYKMPRLIAKVEGKGNGIKTVIVNMPEIAKALCRPAIYPTKYFGAELGAQVQFDQRNERYIVNGAHEANKLQAILDGFIRKYVLCSKCENPETDLLVRGRGKHGELSAQCKACGAVAPVSDAGRTAQFIIKNPPDETGLALASSAAGASKGGKGGGGGGGRRRRGAGDETTTTAGGGGGGESEQQQQQQHPDADDDDDEEDDAWLLVDSDAEWEGEEAAATAAAAAEELPASVQRLIVTEELLALTPQDRADRLHRFVSERLAAGAGGGSGSVNPAELVAEAERLDIRDKAVLVVAEVLLASPATLVSDITKTHRAALLAFTARSQRAQKYLMGGVESLVARFPEALLDAKRIPNLLHAFYSADLLSEEVLLEWDAKGPSRRHTGDRKLSRSIHEMAKPFINWLKTADEESSSEEEEADEAREEAGRPPVVNGKARAQEKEAEGANDNGADSDVDIDDI